jgi:hypothetical protein
MLGWIRRALPSFRSRSDLAHVVEVTSRGAWTGSRQRYDRPKGERGGGAECSLVATDAGMTMAAAYRSIAIAIRAL